MNQPGRDLQGAGADGEEFGVMALVLAVWKFKYWIALGTVLACAYGLYVGFTTTPVYEATATLTPKDANKGSSNPLSSKLGGLGGIMGLQLGSGNASLDRIEIILKGHELAEAVIDKYDLMPKLHPKQWDPRAKAWRDSTKIPSKRMAIDVLRNSRLGVSPDPRKSVIRLSMHMHDSVLAKEILESYLAELNARLYSDAKKEAETNRAYLEAQMVSTVDPVMREKISSLISFEIEKYMLVASQSFDVLERPQVPTERLKPKRKSLLIISFFAGLFASTLAAMAWIILRRNLPSLGGQA